MLWKIVGIVAILFSMGMASAENSIVDIKDLSVAEDYFKIASFVEEQEYDKALIDADKFIEKYQNYHKKDIIENMLVAVYLYRIEIAKKQENKERIIYYSDDFVKKYENNKNDEIKTVVASTLRTEGYSLIDVGRPKQALAIFEKIISNYENSTNKDLLSIVSISYIPYGAMLSEANKDNEALNIYKKIISKYKNSKNVALQRQVVMALNNISVIYYAKKQDIQGLKISEQIISQYSNNSDEIIEEYTSRAYSNKAYTLHILDKKQESIDTYNFIVQKYKNNTNKYVIFNVALAKFFIALSSEDVQGLEYASGLFKDFIYEYKDSNDEGIVKYVKYAILNIKEIDLVTNKKQFLSLQYSKSKYNDVKQQMLIDMLDIIFESKTTPQDEQIAKWARKYQGIKAESWKFGTIEKWIKNSQFSNDTKDRISRYIIRFKSHIY